MIIEFDEEIRRVAPCLKVIVVESDVVNAPTGELLWNELTCAGTELSSRYAMAEINKRRAIAATRAVYKALGKDPNRYRPSAEALCRRLVRGLGLYRTDSVIDAINLISVLSGYSIGGFDLDRIDGDKLMLGVGRQGEPFEAIGRGPLNIAGLPVYRDRTGGIGTPTSDCERTKLQPDTVRLLMLINVYGEEMPVGEVADLSVRLLSDYCRATAATVREIAAAVR